MHCVTFSTRGDVGDHPRIGDVSDVGRGVRLRVEAVSVANLSATRGGEAVVPTSSQAPRVAGRARRLGALIEVSILGLSKRRSGSVL